MKLASSRFLRFCCIGLPAMVGSIALLYLLADVIGIQYVVAFAITFVVANSLAYLASRRWAFETTTVTHGAGLARYFAVTSASLVVNSGLMALLVSGGGLSHVVAATLLSAVNAPVNFLLHRRVTFRITDAPAS